MMFIFGGCTEVNTSALLDTALNVISTGGYYGLHCSGEVLDDVWRLSSDGWHEVIPTVRGPKLWLRVSCISKRSGTIGDAFFYFGKTAQGTHNVNTVQSYHFDNSTFTTLKNVSILSDSTAQVVLL